MVSVCGQWVWCVGVVRGCGNSVWCVCKVSDSRKPCNHDMTRNYGVVLACPSKDMRFLGNN